MAKILYGVAGEGSGHASRAKEIINHLKDCGHEIKIVSYDRGFAVLSQYFEVEKIFGLNFAMENNQVRYLSTITKNLEKFPEAAKSIKKILKMIDEFPVQVVISDFEPISSIVSKIKKLPLICIDNQRIITKTKIDYPKKYILEASIAKIIINLDIAVKPKNFLITSFFKEETTDSRAFIFPPILRKEIFGISPQTNDYILVYLSSKSENLIKIFEKVDEKFIIYGFDKNENRNNIVFKKASSENFLNDLSDCKGVVANAGFALIAEALYLGKPYLALPIKGQFEQILNAHYLEKLGYGKHCECLDKKEIESFLRDLKKYRKNLENYKKENNSEIFKKIDELIGENSQ
ncbi:MAG: MJ1255/VC2487 family glycosyltransferase [bacterium]